jgi:hypothetical protein
MNSWGIRLPGRKTIISASFALAGAWLAWQCGAGLGAAVASPDNGSPILWMLALLAMSVMLLLLATRTTHQRLFTLAFLPMLIFTPMAYELSFQDDALAMFTGFVGVVSPAVIIAILVLHYRRRAEMATPIEAIPEPVETTI